MTIPEQVPPAANGAADPQQSATAGPHVPFRDVRDCAVSLSLTGVERDEATRILVGAASGWLDAETAACDLALARAVFRQRFAAEEVGQREAALVAATQSAERLRDLERQKLEREETSRQAAEAIRRQRHAAEAKRLQDEIEKIRDECDATVAQISRERVENHDRHVEEWKTAGSQRQDEIKVLDAARKDISERLEETRTRYRGLMNPFMTYHAASFLIWAGYSAIAATGAAVTFLLDKHGSQSVLSDIFSAAAVSMEHLRQAWSYPLLMAAIYLILALGSITGAFWLTDLLTRHFDKRWKSGEKKRSDFAPGRLGLRGIIRRQTFVQTLVAIPYVYAIGLFLAFLTYRVPAGPINDQFLGYVLPTFAHSFIGSAMTLLAASIFVMYITNISEPRLRNHSDVGKSWRKAWEIGVIPAALLVAVGFAVFGTHDRQIWGGITAFMLIGSMALAYGLVYRGMFAELRYQEAVLDDHGRRIEGLMEPPSLPQASKFEAREISRVRAAARDRRQAILDLERKRSIRRLFLGTDDQDASLVSQFEVALSAIERLFGRKVQPRPEFYRDVDLEVAPDDVARRKEAEADLGRIALEIEEARKKTEAIAGAERDCEDARKRKRDLDEAIETAGTARAEVEARVNANTASYLLDFRRAYELGTSMKGVYAEVDRRTADAVKRARWRPPTSVPPHPPGHDTPPATPVATPTPTPPAPPAAPVNDSLEVAS